MTREPPVNEPQTQSELKAEIERLKLKIEAYEQKLSDIETETLPTEVYENYEATIRENHRVIRNLADRLVDIAISNASYVSILERYAELPGGNEAKAVLVAAPAGDTHIAKIVGAAEAVSEWVRLVTVAQMAAGLTVPQVGDLAELYKQVEAWNAFSKGWIDSVGRLDNTGDNHKITS